MPAFVLALDDQGRIAIWNRRLERVTGYPRAEMLGTDGRGLVATDERPTDLPLKAGGIRKVRWNRDDVSIDARTRMVYAVGIDVTDEEEMLRRVLRAERLAAVGTMAAGLAHEVRNPLNSASLQLAVLERRMARGDSADRTKPVIGIIKSEIERLDRLVRDFLAFAKPSPLEPRPVNLGELIEAVADLIRPEAETAGVTVSTVSSVALPPAAGDSERLRQVLLNLTRNAIEAMSAKGGHLALRATPGADTVDLAVEDDGPGFADDLPIFDAFFTTKDQGTGLGLSLVHRIVADHGGTIRVESRPGRTCFTVTLPRATRPRP
jgi:signal transduction histidine kinase